MPYVIETVRGLLGKKPIFGICLGHQMLGLALGGRTYKLKFGHRGANHPVMDQRTGRIDITSQNHGFCVDMDSLDPAVVELTHVNLYDRTNEGMRHRTLPAFSVQYHPEASPGPHDARHLFDDFIALMERHRAMRRAEGGNALRLGGRRRQSALGRWSKRLLAALVCGGLFLLPFFGWLAAEPTPYSDPAGHFTITPPDGWSTDDSGHMGPGLVAKGPADAAGAEPLIHLTHEAAGIVTLEVRWQTLLGQIALRQRAGAFPRDRGAPGRGPALRAEPSTSSSAAVRATRR